MDLVANRSLILLRALERIQANKGLLSNAKSDHQQTYDGTTLCRLCPFHVQHAVVLICVCVSAIQSCQLYDYDHLLLNLSELGDFGAYFHSYLRWR